MLSPQAMCTCVTLHLASSSQRSRLIAVDSGCVAVNPLVLAGLCWTQHPTRLVQSPKILQSALCCRLCQSRQKILWLMCTKYPWVRQVWVIYYYLMMNFRVGNWGQDQWIRWDLRLVKRRPDPGVEPSMRWYKCTNTPGMGERLLFLSFKTNTTGVQDMKICPWYGPFA